MTITREELETRFTYHAPNEEQVRRHESIRTLAGDIAQFITTHTPASREQSLAITKLEEAMMWANAAIARRE